MWSSVYFSVFVCVLVRFFCCCLVCVFVIFCVAVGMLHDCSFCLYVALLCICGFDVTLLTLYVCVFCCSVHYELDSQLYVVAWLGICVSMFFM